MLNRGLLIILAGTMFFGTLFGQAYEKEKFATAQTDWEVGVVTGYFSGGRVWKGQLDDGVPAKAETDGGLLVGVRFGADQEYFGVEGQVSGVFEDMDLKADSADTLPSVSDASWLLGNVNALWYPFGNTMADGRVKPFFTAGPGVAHFMSDFDKADGETYFDTNVGIGVKFLLGEQGNPDLRFDYRWHMMVGGGSGMVDPLWRQEITVGLGIRF